MSVNNTTSHLLPNTHPLTSTAPPTNTPKTPIQMTSTGFHYRPPQPPHRLTSPITHEDDLFQTIHMGTPKTTTQPWSLTITGLVHHPFTITWPQLLSLPTTTVTSFHECYGSPIKPPTSNPWRIGNVTWTGVPLSALIDLATPHPTATHVWSDGSDHGSFGTITAPNYQKDMTLSKATDPTTLLAYQMNGAPLSEKRGGPVRLIVPGWYGTNSTKWLCAIHLQNRRSNSPFTTTYYNEIDPTDPHGLRLRPCWDVEPNSFLLTKPSTEGTIRGPNVTIAGRAWSAVGIRNVSVCIKEDGEWVERAVITLSARTQYEWQDFETTLLLSQGEYEVMARATDLHGTTQPLSGRRNHVHIITILVD